MLHIVSTHAPLAGSDDPRNKLQLELAEFQPTLPLRGATCYRLCYTYIIGWFQPTLPLRGATLPAHAACVARMFQPTLPLRGATADSQATVFS